jgi:uncharacterized protein (TIGR02453 family)
MPKHYFTPELFQFLRQLKRNNRREWFLKNRDRYEAVVRQPALAFITDFRFRLRQVSPWVVADPKPNGGSLFRIYRDIRFSKDKSPYKTHVAMHFRHAGSKEDVHGAGFYLHLEPGQCFLAAGNWQPEPRTLARIRDAIAWKPEEWKKATRKLSLDGNRLTRPPKGYGADHPMIEDLKFKDYIAGVNFTEAQVCSPNFMNNVVSGCRQLAPMVGFLCRAVGLQF